MLIRCVTHCHTQSGDDLGHCVAPCALLCSVCVLLTLLLAHTEVSAHLFLLFLPIRNTLSSLTIMASDWALLLSEALIG